MGTVMQNGPSPSHNRGSQALSIRGKDSPGTERTTSSGSLWPLIHT